MMAIDTADIVRAIGGGLLIGMSAALLFAVNGRIAGVSGMIRRLFHGDGGASMPGALFLAGLVAGAWFIGSWTGTVPLARPNFPAALLILAGVLVAVGTSWANGCTSGHGVCGLARFSPRSMAAVAVFLTSGVATAYGVRHVWGIS